MSMIRKQVDDIPKGHIEVILTRNAEMKYAQISHCGIKDQGTQRSNKNYSKIKQTISECLNNIKQSKISVIGVPEEEMKES